MIDERGQWTVGVEGVFVYRLIEGVSVSVSNSVSNSVRPSSVYQVQ